MKTIIILILIITTIVILTLWLKVKNKPVEYLYFKPIFSPTIHHGEEFESDVQK